MIEFFTAFSIRSTFIFWFGIAFVIKLEDDFKLAKDPKLTSYVTFWGKVAKVVEVDVVDAVEEVLQRSGRVRPKRFTSRKTTRSRHS